MLYFTFLVVSVGFEDASTNQGLYTIFHKQTAALHFSATSQPIVDPAVVGFDSRKFSAKSQLVYSQLSMLKLQDASTIY